MKFKVGDRVSIPCYSTRSDGTIVSVLFNGTRIGVCHDKKMNGHDLEGNCEYGYGWYYDSDELVLNNSSNILILLL